MERRIVLGGKIASTWKRGLVGEGRGCGGKDGNVMGAGVRMTVRKGEVLARAAVEIALVKVEVLGSEGKLIQVKELERKVWRGDVLAPRWESSGRSECHGSWGWTRVGLV